MAGVAFVQPTYGDVSRKEDVVLNAVEILTAKETQIFNMLGKTTAIDTIHSYLVDNLKAAAANSVEETSDYTYTQRTTPTRQTNIVQIIAIPLRVSRTAQEVSHYHGQDELTRQTNKALMEWANDAEFNLLRSTLTSGVSGTTAPTMSKQNIYGKIKKMYSLWKGNKKLEGKALLVLLFRNKRNTKNCMEKGRCGRRETSIMEWRKMVLCPQFCA